MSGCQTTEGMRPTRALDRWKARRSAKHPFVDARANQGKKERSSLLYLRKRRS